MEKFRKKSNIWNMGEVWNNKETKNKITIRTLIKLNYNK